MPENLHQHVWTYIVAGIMVPMMLNKALLFPSKVEKWVLLILAGIFWPLTLVFIAVLLLVATVIVSVKEVFRRVRGPSAEVRETFQQGARNAHHRRGHDETLRRPGDS